ncbi:MAG: hypothetical protein GX557_08915, partial [Chloroflexi bacterium]|nr:hypothetical protein [Chloroflexota bacterium]
MRTTRHTIVATAWSVLLVAVLLAAPMLQIAASGPATTPALSTTPAIQAADSAIVWLKARQAADGSFSSGSDHPVGVTADVVTAAAAVGQDALSWRSGAGKPSVYDYLASHAATYANATNAANAGRLLVALVAANLDPRAFSGQDYVAATLAYHAGAGSFGVSATEQAWAILGLTAAREPLPAGAVAVLVSRQQADGGWDGGWGSDTRTTALALQALIAAGYDPESSDVLADGLAYLEAHRAPTGGYYASSAWGTNTADTFSTATCIQAMLSLDENPLAPARQVAGRSALDDLLARQIAGGGFGEQPSDGATVAATTAALPALFGRALPLAGTHVAVWHALNYLAAYQATDGSFEGSLSASSDGLLAIASAGELARLWRPLGGASLIEFLDSATGLIIDSGLAGRLATALAMVDENPYLVGNTNVIDLLWSYYDPATGSFDPFGETYNHILALWGLSAVGETVPQKALDWLWAAQNADGGWGWGSGMGSDTNSTALALQALIAAGATPGDSRVSAALAYLASQQAGNAGFSWDITAPWDSGPDANSTALVIQGLLAADPTALDGRDWARSLTAANAITLTVHTPTDRLLAFQLDNGAFEWQSGPYGGPNYLATVQAIPALEHKPFPWQ